MAALIKLTDGGHPVWVNADHVIMIRPAPMPYDGTHVKLADGTDLYVQEVPENIASQVYASA